MRGGVKFPLASRPSLRRLASRPSLRWMAIALAAGALPGPLLHAALAACAGTLFEAAPFLLAAELLPSPAGRCISELAGCGCGREIPGALSLPATALCWLAFGPAVALARFAAALLVLAMQRRALPPRQGRAAPAATHGRAAPAPPAEADTLGELAGLATVSAPAALAAQALAAHAQVLSALPLATPALFAAGLVIGALGPCATAGIAVAAALAGPAPPAAAGILAVAGLRVGRAGLREPLAGPRVKPAGLRLAHVGNVAGEPTGDRGDARFASLLLAAALGALGWLGPSGLVNPRLVPLDAAAAILALCGRRRTSRLGPGAAGVPALMLVALVAGSPVPGYLVDATDLASAAPGERLAFVGTAHAVGATTILQRFAITCCRVDASPIAVRLDRRLPVPAGDWVRANGTLVRAVDGTLELRPSDWRRIAAPADPFTYR